jgi:uncharacterized protein with HEPN domain
MSPDEIDRLRHMRDAAAAAVTFSAGRSRADLETDLMYQFAAVRAIEIIGEAAARLSDATRAGHPHLPWADMIGMRNRLVHGYFDVDLDVVWNTITAHLPPLIVSVDAMIAAPAPPAASNP